MCTRALTRLRALKYFTEKENHMYFWYLVFYKHRLFQIILHTSNIQLKNAQNQKKKKIKLKQWSLPRRGHPFKEKKNLNHSHCPHILYT